MKVLFLNPHIRSEHPVAKDLQARNITVLPAANVQEAEQMLSLHGATLDLAVIHREDSASANSEAGFRFLSKLKADPLHADIPVIVTSQFWGDAEFAKHQGTPQGANAYLRWPFDAAALYSLIEAVFGGSIPSSEASKLISLEEMGGGTGVTRLAGVSSPSIPTASDTSGSIGFVLEEPSAVLGKGAGPDPSSLSLQLEMPEGHGEHDNHTRLAMESPAGLSSAQPSVPPSAPPSAPMEPTRVHTGASLDIAPLEITQTDATRVASGTHVSDALSSVLAQAGEPVTEPAAESVSEAEAAQEMPYLFGGGAQASQQAAAPAAPTPVAFALPLGDAVVPGGAAHAPDTETLKKYLLLREQDVAVLSTQLKAAKEQVAQLESQVRLEKARSNELTHMNGELERKLSEFEKEKQHVIDGAQAEVSELKFQLKAKTDKARLLESQVREAADETERLKERVRTDIRKIRVREKELENRLEIMKKDSEALIVARENKIIELKRKLDLLEFNLDLLQDQHSREKENAAKLRERLAKAAQVVRVAGGLLDTPGGASQLAAALGSDPAGEEATGTDEDVA